MAEIWWMELIWCFIRRCCDRLLIMHDGDEGLFVAYDNVEFLAPVYAGDYIEAVGEIVKVEILPQNGFRSP